MKDKPLVSVVIPSYNRSNTIERAINSVVNQTFKNFEIIVVDDASTDNTLEVIQQYTKNKNFKYLSLKNNVGGAEARNIGIKEAKGTYIAFQDSDDEWLPEKLEKQINYFNKNNVDVVFSKIERVININRSVFPKKEIHGELNTAKLLQLNYIGTPSAIIKKQALLNINGFDKTLSRLQDWDLFIRLSRNCKFYMIPQVLCIAYLQENSITNNTTALVNTLKIFDNKYKEDIEKLSKNNQSAVYERYGSLLVNSNEKHYASKFFIKGLKIKLTNFKLLIKYLLLKIGGIKLYKLLK